MKPLLSFLGQMLFAVLTVVGIAMLLYYMDLTDAPGIWQGLVKRVQGEFSQSTRYLQDLNLPDLTSPDPSNIQVTAVGNGKIDKTNLVPNQPLPIVTMQADAVVETLTPADTPTPVPPMDPVVYQTEATIRLKRFADALERWLASNDQLMRDNSLLHDAAWRDQVTANLAEVAAGGRQLANIGQPPQQYAEIDGWLVRAGMEAERLQAYYLQALKTGSASDFTSAGDSFTRIKKFLSQAAQGMLLAGWKFDQ